jgi:hypothetical protein
LSVSKQISLILDDGGADLLGHRTFCLLTCHEQGTTQNHAAED